jgi:hypothetical protein
MKHPPGWEKNLKLFNDSVEVIITLEVGPRIISYRPVKSRSVSRLVDEQAKRNGSLSNSFSKRGARTVLRAGAPSAMIQLGKGLSLRCPSPAPPHELVRKGGYFTILGEAGDSEIVTLGIIWQSFLRAF